MEQTLVQFPKLGLNFSVTREAFVIGDFAIYWYAVIIAVGAILAVIYAMVNARKYGVHPDKLLDLAIVALLFGIVGARLYYVIFNLDSYSSFLDMINIRDGGLAIYGGLIFGIAAAFIMSRITKMRFLPALDVAAGGFFIGQAIGRWGNFVNQEAFGINTDLPFGMFSEKTKSYLESVGWDLFKSGIDVDPSSPVHPCFLYESVWCVIGFLLILLYRKRRKFDGEIFLFYAAWYGLGRGVIEGLRTDSLMVGSIRVSQVLSFVACTVSVFLIIFLRIRISKKRKDDPEYMMLYENTKESREQFMEDDETVIEKSEALLSEAYENINKAEGKLALLSGEQSGEGSGDLEDIADTLCVPDELLDLADKQVDLALNKLFLVTELLERFEQKTENKQEEDNQDTASDNEISPDEAENDGAENESEELSANERADVIREQISSVKEYMENCRVTLEYAKITLETKQQEDAETEKIGALTSEEANIVTSDATVSDVAASDETDSDVAVSDSDNTNK